MKRQIFYWVRSDSGEIFRNVGFEADGTLHNPNGYPTEAVRAAVEATLAHWHMRRSAAAKKAALTRARRREKLVYSAARTIAARQETGPRDHCYVCGRGLNDPDSVKRGIGSECWQDVLSSISRILTPATGRADQP